MLVFAFTAKARSQQMVYLWPDSLKGQWINVWSMTVTDSGIFAGTNNFIFGSTDNGNTWSQIKNGIPSPTCVMVAQSASGNLIVANDLGGTPMSTDGGHTWHTTIPPQPSTNWGSVGSVFADGNTLLVGNNTTGNGQYGTCIARSNTDSSTWQYVATQSGAGVGAPLKFVALKSGNILLASGSYYSPTSTGDSTRGGILRSTDDGETWNWSNTGLYVQNVWSLAVDTTSGKVFAGTRYGDIYSSTDDGLTWQKMRGPSWASQTSGVNSLLAYRGKLFAGFSNPVSGTIGLAYTKDGGATWMDVGDDISSVPGSMCLSLAQIGDTLLIGTADGIWADTKVLTAVHSHAPSIPSGFQLSQNYPNPFNPTTTIQYSLPSRTFVTLDVFNAIGQKVKTLVSGEQSSGVHEIQFNGNNLPSGVYFYHLSAGTFSKTEKMVLIK